MCGFASVTRIHPRRIKGGARELGSRTTTERANETDGWMGCRDGIGTRGACPSERRVVTHR